MQLTTTTPAGGQVLDGDAVARLYEAFFAGKSPRTVEAYRRDLDDFRAFAKADNERDALRLLLMHGPGRANETALGYKADMQRRGLKAATVNRRLAALRSAVKLARTIGLVGWALEVQGAKRQAYRDTRGPELDGVRGLLREAGDRRDAKGVRDAAIIRVLYDLGLRREEVCRLDFEDLDRRGSTLAVRGKGRSEKEKLTLPDPTREALQSWLDVRGEGPGPLFTNFDRAKKGEGRLTGNGLYRVVRGLGDKIGTRARPHGLRHSAITAVLDLSGGDLRAAAKFSRHRDIRVLTFYDDSRQDHAGELARRLAAGL